MDVEGGGELYTVSVKGNGIVIEKSVSVQVARQVINAVMGGAVNESAWAPGKHANAVSEVGSDSRRTSLREFLEDSLARRNPDKIITIAEYLLRFEDKELVTREDIRGRFRSAGEAVPANFPRDFTWAVKNGWLVEDPKSSNLFYVTQKGRSAIENRFSGEIKKGTPQPNSRRRARKTNTMRSVDG